MLEKKVFNIQNVKPAFLLICASPSSFRPKLGPLILVKVTHAPVDYFYYVEACRHRVRRKAEEIRELTKYVFVHIQRFGVEDGGSA